VALLRRIFLYAIYSPATKDQAEISDTGTNTITKTKPNMHLVHSRNFLIQYPRSMWKAFIGILQGFGARRLYLAARGSVDNLGVLRLLATRNDGRQTQQPADAWRQSVILEC
jgi:hypothetical protein